MDILFFSISDGNIRKEGLSEVVCLSVGPATFGPNSFKVYIQKTSFLKMRISKELNCSSL